MLKMDACQRWYAPSSSQPVQHTSRDCSTCSWLSAGGRPTRFPLARARSSPNRIRSVAESTWQAPWASNDRRRISPPRSPPGCRCFPGWPRCRCCAGSAPPGCGRRPRSSGRAGQGRPLRWCLPLGPWSSVPASRDTAGCVRWPRRNKPGHRGCHVRPEARAGCPDSWTSRRPR